MLSESPITTVKKMTTPSLKRIAIAGADGTMGTLFTKRFTEVGCEVRPLVMPYTEEAIKAALSGAEMVLLCVPVTVMGEVIKQIKPHLEEGTILADVGSVKNGPMKEMLAHYDGPVVGTHPLFGDGIPDGFVPKAAIAPGREGNEADQIAADRISALFTACGYVCFDTTAEEHDRAMAFIQGLNFTSTVAFLAASKDIQNIKNFVTPSFKRRLDSARKMLTDDKELFTTISEANPYLQESNRKLMSYLSVAAGGDLDLLSERAQWWWR
jgi:prephenate dehydrogenase